MSRRRRPSGRFQDRVHIEPPSEHQARGLRACVCERITPPGGDGVRACMRTGVLRRLRQHVPSRRATSSAATRRPLPTTGSSCAAARARSGTCSPPPSTRAPASRVGLANAGINRRVRMGQSELEFALRGPMRFWLSALVAIAVPAGAHHPFTPYYDASKPARRPSLVSRAR